jgi:hypothetical protein
VSGAGVPIPAELREAAARIIAGHVGRPPETDDSRPRECVRRTWDVLAEQVVPLVVAAAFRAVAAEWRAHAAEVHEQADQAVTALRRRTQGRTAMAWEARAAELDRRADRLEREATT